MACPPGPGSASSSRERCENEFHAGLNKLASPAILGGEPSGAAIGTLKRTLAPPGQACKSKGILILNAVTALRSPPGMDAKSTYVLSQAAGHGSAKSPSSSFRQGVAAVEYSTNGPEV